MDICNILLCFPCVDKETALTNYAQKEAGMDAQLLLDVVCSRSESSFSVSVGQCPPHICDPKNAPHRVSPRFCEGQNFPPPKKLHCTSLCISNRHHHHHPLLSRPPEQLLPHHHNGLPRSTNVIHKEPRLKRYSPIPVPRPLTPV